VFDFRLGVRAVIGKEEFAIGTMVFGGGLQR
jgi:hypothetical protein